MSHPSQAQSKTDIHVAIGQKLMLDLRFFCEEGNSASCRTPVTQLPESLKTLLNKHHIGGVILFSENTQTIAQTYQLVSELHKNNNSKTPLFISIDQEGGRVARINREQATSFTGNMSIGATYQKHGTHYATEVATVIGKELNALGINVNFAPTVDVNINPLNPVINVRSFGEDPAIVAKLGAAQVTAFEQQGVISALKHFPGHGDTHVDSHTGLPLVEHDKQTIYNIDLKPFADIIKTSPPGMIMTAHIQYPNLDNSTVVNRDGKSMIRPATMSKKIMTDLLRNELGYKGVTITDALDMAGISAFFDPLNAVIETFNAGVDIALMPIPIRNPQDVKAFDVFMTDLLNAVESGKLNKKQLLESEKRIAQLKASLPKPMQFSQAQASALIGNPSHRAIEKALARDSITLVKNDGLLPFKNTVKRIHIVMPDARKGEALKQALEHHDKTIEISYSSLQALELERVKQHIRSSDIVIAAHASPAQSAVEIGGMEDVSLLKAHRLQAKQQPQVLESLLDYAKSINKPSVFVSLRAPYEIKQLGRFSEAILATYAYNIDIDNDNQVSGPAFTALADALLGKSPIAGTLPVTIN